MNKRVFIKSCVLSFIFFLSMNTVAQETVHYTMMDGLSSTDVTSVCEDDNFLWIATNDGLNRFDGNSFKVYRKDLHSNNSLSENSIETLMVDKNGLLWIGLKTGGVDVYNPKKDRFIHLKDKCKVLPQRVISIYEDSEHDIWLGSWGEGLFRLSPKNKCTMSYTVTRHYQQNIVSSLMEKPKGKLWIGTYYGYYLYDINKKRGINLGRNDLSVTNFLNIGKDNHIFVSTWTGGLYEISWNNQLTSFAEKKLTSAYCGIYRLTTAPSDRFYLGTWGNGIKIVRRNGTYDKSLPLDIPITLSLYRDRYDNLWIGTYGMGLYRIPKENNGIRKISFRNEMDAPVYTLQRLGGRNLVLGTQGRGLYLYDYMSKSIQNIALDYNDKFQRYILSTYVDNRVLIIGTDGSGLQYFPISDKDHISSSPQYFFIDKNFGKITSIFRKNDSTFFIGTKQSGVYSLRYDLTRRKFVCSVHYTDFGTEEITGFASSGNKLWVTSHDGIYLYDFISGRNRKVGHNFNEMVYCMLQDKMKHCLWLGTSDGLMKLDYSRGIKIERSVFTDIIPEGAVRNVVMDVIGNLWFSVRNHVFCYICKTNEVKEINLGKNSVQMLYSSVNCNIEDKPCIVLGGADGLLTLDPRTLLNLPDRSKILLTELQIDNKVVKVGQEVYGKVLLNEDTEYISTLTLSYLCKWISLSFKEIGSDGYMDKYQYFIDGFSEKWNTVDLSKQMTFSQLQPGNYTLRIRRYSASGTINSKPIYTLRIIVTPPFWKTKTFVFLIIVILILSACLIIYLVLLRMRKKHQMKLKAIEKKKNDELLREKESFFTGLSHDLLTSFSLIIAPVKDLLRDKGMNENQQKKLSIISDNANYLSDIFATILDFKRTELNDNMIVEKEIEIVSFIDFIINAFSYLAKSKQIRLSFVHNVDSLNVMIDTVKLERILYNLISNAIKYNKNNGSVDVVLNSSEDADIFSVIVEDTGIGISTSDKTHVFDKFYQVDKARISSGLGLGLYTTKRFVKLMNGEITIDSVINEGTSITVSFKVKHPKNFQEKDEKEDVDFVILLVEDNVQLREYLGGKLSEHFAVAEASDGLEAMEYIKSNLPELVISDIMMPGMDGLELCSIVKNTPLFADIFIVLLSAKASSEDEIAGYRAGADLYLKKPFDPDILINQIINIYNTRLERRKQIISDLISPKISNDSLQSKNDFICRATKIVEKHLSEEEFNIEDFAAEMNLSKTVLFRKFKTNIDETPNIFMKNVRLKKASELLLNSELSISEVAYTVGFRQVHYFIKCFKEIYQETPKGFRNLYKE
jgi:signal transduction histidine kinase/ligand-binding sensor domain-containing protein/DNA-binding response OmpR family regulator